jgi:NAD-dependent dihydropyrimidine dehydrogenase PreA subunit
MVIQVNQELCTGCGACIDACSVEAIQLLDQCAVIDDGLCTQCEACIDACPNEAIITRSILEPSGSIMTLPAVEPTRVPVRDRAALPETAAPVRGLAPLAGAALTFLGSEVAPRLVDVLMTALERRLARQSTTAVTSLPISSGGRTTRKRGKQRQTRYHGGRIGNRNPKERR